MMIIIEKFGALLFPYHLYAFINNPRCRGFIQSNPAELWNFVLDPIPQPNCNMLACGVFKSRYIIQQFVVNALNNWVDRFFYVREIHDPSKFIIQFSFKIQGQSVGMAMNPLTFMSLWNLR